ncbi:hypothetical protein [Cytobacillus pseudoceanisediminis]|uniref:hypothetical protein n=1 Tax=Cytobacillus pseudoceanisediminis TaxID=3051614 RepID=UPI003CF250B9
MKKVTVQYRFENVINPRDNEPGVLFGDKVLVTEEGFGLYQAIKTDNPNVVIVDLDENVTDHLAENPTFLIDLIVSDPGGGSFVQA